MNLSDVVRMCNHQGGELNRLRLGKDNAHELMAILLLMGAERNYWANDLVVTFKLMDNGRPTTKPNISMLVLRDQPMAYPEDILRFFRQEGVI